MFSTAATPHNHRIAASLRHLLLLQAQARTLQMPSARRALRQRRGGHHSVMRGRGMSLAEVRPYQPGDDVRRIDWRVTARRQEPHTRVYEEERERPVLVLCDLGPGLFFASEGCYKQVRAAELAALLAWVAHGSGDQAGGIVFDGDSAEVIRPSRRRRSVMQLLNALSSHQRHEPYMASEPGTDGLNEALTEARRIVHTGSRLFVISDFQGADTDTRSLLAGLAMHNQVTAVLLTDPLDSHLPDHGHYAVGGQGGTIWFDGDDRALQRAWHESSKSRFSALESLFRQTGTNLLTLSTGEEPVTLMHGLTSAGGRLL